MLANLVRAGKMPPLDKRLPDKPVVVKPLEEVGTYGGTAHVYTTTSVYPGPEALAMVNQEMLLSFESDLTWGHPSIAEGVDLASDGKSLTIHLRKGLKWSDGIRSPPMTSCTTTIMC